ncbi:glycosyltransferase [Aliarcobacter butzleri]|uniref:glycosyltransferase n=1 Tax=Aliarcobacter butzleri TaxID=28197 RepID=UPI003B222355
MNKNILILGISLKKGGAERIISLLVKEFIKDEKINIHLLMMENEVEYQLPKNVRLIVLSKNKKSGLRKFIELPFVAWKLSKYIKQNNISVVMSFLYRANYINLLAKFFGTKHKSIINIVSTTSRYLNEGLLGKVNLFLINSLFNKADLIVSNSKGVDEDLKSLISITTKTQVIHNPIDIEYINEKKNTCEDTVFYFRNNIKYIISVGRLIPLKRNKDLIKAFYKLQESDNNIEVIFLGDGILKYKLEQYCIELKIQEKVHFLGNVSNPFYYLNKSNLFVLNSELEGLPNVLLEAMVCDLPVISSDCKSGPREILEDEKYGYLYPVGDTETLIEKMKIVLYGNIDLVKIKKNNLERVENFRINKIMKKYKEIL